MKLFQRNGDGKRVSKRNGFAFGVFGAIVAVFIVTALFQSQGIQINIETNPEKAQANPLTVENTEKNNIKAIQAAQEAVVGVSAVKEGARGEKSAGTGSGVIYKKDGDKALVVTNHHVIEQASDLEVTLSDGTKTDAELQGSDPFTDLAVLEIDAEHVSKVADFAKSEDVEVGQTAFAIGNPLGMDFAGSVTKGIVSGLDRNVPVDLNGDSEPDWHTTVLQTDAAINPGNSGGALINQNGKVIGINSMKIAKAEVEGIGFAIPAETVTSITSELESKGEVERPYIGVSLYDLSQLPARAVQGELNLPENVEGGAVVGKTATGTPAAEAGLKQNDVITAINGETVASTLDLRKYLYEDAKAGDEATLTVYRNGQQQQITLTLSEQ
ncbi:S1C family serine protease [Salimicrobium salexigens]|uniref:Serine protease Do n=1 Tax=Salimicrobium salexigens TaxID=908941 RepID=A0ABY1KZ69_9BACI|nr:trypsin-like peptidase domain-containing protein [Salimicrobium salexigens]SIS80912.1 serine protease Do [Salimicrobium salexigens]